MSPRLGEILCADDVLAPIQLQQALRRAAAKRSRLGTALVELKLVDSDQLATALARQHGLPAVRDKHFAGIADETRKLLSSELAHRHGAVPIGVVNGGTELVVAMRDPDDVVARQSIAAATGYKVRPGAAGEVRINRALEQLYGPAQLELATAPMPPTAPARPRTLTPTRLAVDPYFTPPPVRRPPQRPAAPPVDETPVVNIGGFLTWALIALVALDIVLGLALSASPSLVMPVLIDVMIIGALLNGRMWAAWVSLLRFGMSWWLLVTFEHHISPDLYSGAQVFVVTGVAVSLLCVVLLRE